MADKKISELTSIVGADTAADDFFVVVDTSGSVTKKISRAELNNAIEQDVLAQVDITSANIDGGTIDNTPIGSTTASTGNFTTVDTTGNVTVGGNLTVNGTTTTVNSTTLDVDDINITVASGAASAAAADGAGLTVDGASATFNYASTGDKWTMNKPLDVTGTVTADGLTVDTNTLHVDATNNRVGIVQSSPDAELHIGDGSGASDNTRLRLTGGTSGQSTIQFGDTASANIGQIQYDHSNNSLAFRVNAGTRAIIDSSGNVGIGTTSVDNRLHLENAGSLYLQIENTSTANKFYLGNSGGNAILESTGAYSMNFKTNSIERMTITSAGNVGIGTTPSTILHLNDATDPIIRLQRGGGVYSQVQSDGAGSLYLSADAANTTASSRMQFNVDGSEAARISGGSFLVGTSNEAPASNNVSGVALKNGASHFSADGGEALRINRKTSDGQLISLRKNASEIGSVGSYGGVYANIGTGNVGLMFNTGGQAIIPHNMTTNAPRGSGIDLGQTGYKWKDAYFSGYAYASGFAGQSDGNTYVNFPGSDVMQFYTGGSERARLDAQGNLLWGTTSKDTFSVSDGAIVRQTGRFLGTTSSDSVAALSRRGTDGSIVALYKNTSLVGSISVTGSGTTYNTTSDIRLKQDIEPIADGTNKLMAMNPVSYNWKADPDGPRSMGFIAQEMQDVMPEAVSVGDDEDAMMSMDYGRITPILVSALQDAHRKIEELETRIAALEAK